VTDLPPEAVDILYPVLKILGAAIGALSTFIGFLWVGFKWLNGQITATAQALISPVSARIAVMEQSINAAHRRIDEHLGERPSDR
jgi:hypothetical protein